MKIRLATPQDVQRVGDWLTVQATLDQLDLGPTLPGGTLLYMVETSAGKPVGWIDLHSIDTVNRKAEIGGALPDPEGAGFSYRATRQVLKEAFALGFHRISARTLTTNTQVKRLLNLSGFTLEGVERDALLRSGRWVDVEVYAKLNERG